MATAKGAVTISTVAAHAGVSQASVSRVLNGHATVDPAIAERVRRSIEELEYVPSMAARTLANGRSRTIAFVVPDLENPMFHGVLKGFSLAAGADGYRVLIADTAESIGDEAEVALEARRRCDAIVLVAPRMSDRELRELAPKLQPLVLINRHVEGVSAPELAIDYLAAAIDVMEYLHSLGHRHVAYLAGPEQSASNARRELGLWEAERLHPDLDITRIAAGSRMEDGFRSAEKLLATGASAVFAFNDQVALGLLSRLGELAVSVPEDLSVVSIDDVPQAAYSLPPLTTMTVPRLELGTLSWQRMRALVDGGVPEPGVSLRPELVIRSSAGPVPAR